MKKQQYIAIIFLSLLLVAATIYVLFALPVPPNAADTTAAPANPLSWIQSSWDAIIARLS